MFLMEEAFAQLPVNAKEDGDTADVQKTNGDGHQESGQDQPATISTGPVPQGLTNKVDLEPLAIIGMAFQLPDGATDEDTFWDMLVEKRCASREYPKERLNIDAFHSADNNKPCTVSTTLSIEDCESTYPVTRSSQRMRISWKMISMTLIRLSSMFLQQMPRQWIPANGRSWKPPTMHLRVAVYLSMLYLVRRPPFM
jgi:hypothetical protein